MTTEPRSIQVSRTLRPLRLAYLVDPNNEAMVRRVIEASTCRWGGAVSVIVPRYRRRPRDFPDKTLDANGIVTGYLATFEPDFVVECFEGAATGLDFDDRYIGKLEELEEPEWDGDLLWGLSSYLLYSDAYEHEFRFLQRDPPKTILPSCESSTGKLLIDALFGRLPDTDKLGFIKRGYEEAFQPSEEQVDASNYHDLALANEVRLTPLNVSMRGLRQDRLMPRQDGPLFMVVRPSKSADIVDFWNLRALGADVLPVPSNHIGEFVAAYSKISEDKALRPRFIFNQHSVALKAQGVADEDREALAKSMRDSGFPVVEQRWFPPLWDPHHLRLNRRSRVPVEAKSDRIEVSAPGGHIRFTPLPPTFLKDGGGIRPSWANVITLQESSWDSDLATVLPPDLRDMHKLLGTVGRHPPTVCSEGIVLRSRWTEFAEGWTLPRGPWVFKAWLDGVGFNSSPSPAGRTAEQLISAVGGPPLASMVQEPKLIRLIDQAARGLVEQSGKSGKAQPRRRVVRHKDLERVLQEIINDPEERERRLGRLLEAGVLRQGLMVKCSLCEQENWYSLDDLAAVLVCERCLREFPFPRSKPPKADRWAYRPNGPFSAENFAEGAYAVALALRFFLSHPGDHGEATWTTSTELRGPAGKLEFDFGIWLRERYNRFEAPKLVLGECKTFGRFEADDLARIANLATTFPEAIVVLATLDEDLDAANKKSIGELVKNNPQLSEGRLIVLTATELCGSESVLGPPYIWEQKGGRFAEAAEKYGQGRFDLEDLGRASLFLYCTIDGTSED